MRSIGKQSKAAIHDLNFVLQNVRTEILGSRPAQESLNYKALEIIHGVNNTPYPLTKITAELFDANAHNNNIEGHLFPAVHRLLPNGKITEVKNLPEHTHHIISDSSFVAGVFLGGGKSLPYEKPSNNFNQNEREAVSDFLDTSNAHLVPNFTLAQKNNRPIYDTNDHGEIVVTPPTNTTTYFTLTDYQEQELEWAAKLIGYDIPHNVTTQHYLEVCDLLQNNGAKYSAHNKLVDIAERISLDPANASIADIKMLQAGISLYNKDFATKVDGALAPRSYKTNEQIDSYASHTLKQTRAFLDNRTKVFTYNQEVPQPAIPLESSPILQLQPTMH